MPSTEDNRTTSSWKPDTQGFLSISIVVIISIIVIVLLIKPPSIDERTSGVLMTIVGVLLACFKDVYGYSFGSSAGSKQKDDTMTKSLESKDATIAAVARGAPIVRALTGNGGTSEPSSNGTTEVVGTVQGTVTGTVTEASKG